jgi:1,2-phenylacetyl-CoA epoxidase catalytic subunit
VDKEALSRMLDVYIYKKAKSFALKTDAEYLEDMRHIPYVRVSDMSPTVYYIYAKLLLMQFFCEFWGGEQYRRALRSGIVPKKKAAEQFFARIVEEEYGHAMLVLFGAEKTTPGVSGPLALMGINPLLFLESNPEAQICILRIFQHPGFRRWSEIIVYNHFQDRSAKLQLRDFASGPYLPWSHVLATIDTEEAEHVRHGEEWFLRLAKTEEGRHMLQIDVNQWFPHVMDVFGYPGDESKSMKLMLKFGIKKKTNDEARLDFLAEVTPLISQCGLTLPEWKYRSNRPF